MKYYQDSGKASITQVILKYVAVLLLLILLLYLISFALDFQLTGLPVRNNEYGWSGPTYRENPEVRDIGKINYYEGDNYTKYRFYRPLCNLWLVLNGF